MAASPLTNVRPKRWTAAWASSAGDVLHTLATQTSLLKKPPLMRINLQGHAGHGVTPKDIMLHVIRQLGIADDFLERAR